MKRISHAQLAQLATEAAAAPRKRKNLNLHERAEDPIQRMFLVFQPGTYVRPHCHNGRWELLVALAGHVRIPCFDDTGRVTEILEMGPGAALQAVELPAGAWHTVVALEENSTLFEIKRGPYLPLVENDFAPWAPAENTPGAADFERWARRCMARERYVD